MVIEWGVSEENMIIMYYGANYEMALNYIRTLPRVLNISFLSELRNYYIVGTGSTRRLVAAYAISC